MSISPDFIFDLTKNTESSAYKYDLIESEILPIQQKNLKTYDDSSKEQYKSSISLNKMHQTSKFCFNKESSNDINSSSLNLKPNKKFKLTVIRKNNSVSSSSHFFTINKISRNDSMSYLSQNKNTENSNDIHIYIDLSKKQTNNEII